MPITAAHITAANSGATFIEGSIFAAPADGSRTITVQAPASGIPQSKVGKYLYTPVTSGVTGGSRTLRKITAIGAENAQGNLDITVEFPFDMSEFRAYQRLDGTDFTETKPGAGGDFTISIDMADLVAVVADQDGATGVSLVDATSRAYSITEEGILYLSNAGSNFEKTIIENPVINPDDGRYRIDKRRAGGVATGAFVAEYGVQLPANCALVQETGILTGGVLRNLILNRNHQVSSIVRLGRLHAGDIGDDNGDFYTSGGVQVIDEQVSSADEYTDLGLTDAYRGSNTQLIKGTCNLVNSTVHSEANRFFARMYSDDPLETDATNLANEATQTNMLIDWEFQGQIGIRIAGDNTVIKNFTYQEGAWRGLNIRVGSGRTFGPIAGLKAQDSSNLFYQNWADSGTLTTVDGFEVINPDYDGDGEEFVLIQRFGNTGGRTLIIKNFDVTKWRQLENLDTEGDKLFWTVGVNGSSRIIAARDVMVKGIDSDSVALDADNHSKLFIYTESSTTSALFPDKTYTAQITDGDSGFDTTLVHIRNWLANGSRRFSGTPSATLATDVEYINNTSKPAQFSVRSRRYTTSLFTSDLHNGDGALEFTALMLDDPYHSSEDLDDIDAYDKLDTAQKLYDYSKRIMEINPPEIIDTGVFDYFESLDSNDILVPGLDCDIILQTSATINNADINNILSFDKPELTMTIRTDTLATGGSFTGGFDIGDSNDLTIVDTIRGYVRCQNILLGTGHLFTTPDKDFINTNHSVIGSVALPGGQSYVVDGGAYINDLDITRETGTTGAVTIKLVNYNRAAGHPSPNANVVYQDETIINYQLEEGYESGDLRYRAYEYDGDTIQNSGTELTATITHNDDNNTFRLSFDIASGNNVRIAVWYLGYKTTYLNAEQGAQDVELEKYSTAVLDVEAITNADSANNDTAISDYYGESTWTYVFGSGKMTITAPDTAITIPPAATKDLMHRLIAGLAGNNSYEVLKRIAQGDLTADVIDFDVESVVVQASQITDSIHDTIFFNHIASPTDTVWDVQVLDTDGNDQSNAISTNVSGNKVRFASKATNVFVDGSIADRFVSDVAAELDGRVLTRRNIARLGLGVPVVDADGDIDTDITT